MKYLLALLLPLTVHATCDTTYEQEFEHTSHEISTDMPKFLKGATITVTLANGKSSTVPADKFMVVPRKQYFIAGVNKTVIKNTTCAPKDKKNNIMVGVKKEVTDLEVSTATIPGGKKAEVTSVDEYLPTVRYYREDVLSNVGLGVGVDTKGKVEATIGVGF